MQTHENMPSSSLLKLEESRKICSIQGQEKMWQSPSLETLTAPMIKQQKLFVYDYEKVNHYYTNYGR